MPKVFVEPISAGGYQIEFEGRKSRDAPAVELRRPSVTKADVTVLRR